MMSLKKTIIKSILPFLGLIILAGCQPVPVGDTYPQAPEESVYAEAKESAIIATVLFDFDSYKIKSQNYSTLNNMATAMLSPELAGQRFIIQGHTDAVGKLGYNLALSYLRAIAVGDYLISRGVDASYLTYEGFSYLRLKDPANPSSGVNRRVEIVTTF
jgi:outer membrane protein OmpA-like peptidoglycan-associated protein